MSAQPENLKVEDKEGIFDTCKFSAEGIYHTYPCYCTKGMGNGEREITKKTDRNKQTKTDRQTLL